MLKQREQDMDNNAKIAGLMLTNPCLAQEHIPEQVLTFEQNLVT